jgi:hypothetical protein
LREAPKVAFRSISINGEVKRLKSGDTIDSLVLVSDESDRRLGRSWRVDQLNATSLAALMTQGICPPDFRRSSSFVEQLTGRSVEGGFQ